MSRRKRARYEPHVRLYRHELDSAAYRSLSTDARALLIEFRALYNGDGNRIFMSRREIQKRLGVGRMKAENARDELIDRGFIRVLTFGNFNNKRRQATEYALTNQPMENTPGAVATKDFMRWRQKTTGLVSSPDGVDRQPREPAPKVQKHPHGVGEQPRKPLNGTPHGVDRQPTDSIPPGGAIKPMGHKCRNGLILNACCLVCGVWITAGGHEFDDSRHTCDRVSKAAYRKRCEEAAERQHKALSDAA